MLTQQKQWDQEPTTQITTCAKCPYFDPNQGVHGWCGVFDRMAKPLHERTNICDLEIEALEKIQFQPELEPQLAQDAEFEQGKQHGCLDAAERSRPIYAAATCPYSTGYLQGYNSIIHPVSKQSTVPTKPQWSITWNSQWQWYAVWVGKSYAGSATKYEEAERLAQKYVASQNSWQQHREKVLAAYAD